MNRIKAGIKLSKWSSLFNSPTVFQIRVWGTHVSIGFVISHSEKDIWMHIFIPFYVIFIDIWRGKK